ncbi:metal ABC transporter substrate-binding protein [Aureimonas endophytica]|uniref:Metal ABC transporter substrate-binding protein n=1 Tax=Aureimonas endophytica TaxID=2027858 RepID=A0A916ZEU6_9HYPH|nr:metal ABC transporter substrate-binding protein [Aureimonas endophytica]GGD92780.1 metal ABC transporter substrate-binding protein [Aureimonas endophytica]
MMTRRLVLALACTSAILGAVPAAYAKTLNVVASFSVLGDVVSEVGGDKVTVTTLVGPNGDPHEYEPSPDDAKHLKAADLVFVNGLGMEGWMNRLIKASGYKGEPVVASAKVKTRQMEEDGQDVTDPHVWNDPKNVRVWVAAIEAALAKADPADAETFKKNAARYDAELHELDTYAKQRFAKTPEGDRRILTSHDAFGYFGDAYGITFLSPLGLSTESEASATDVAKLIDQIKREKISTYFFENSNDPRLVRQIAEATGAKAGGELYVESLSAKDGPAPTYARMFRYNVDQVANALAKTN